VECLGDCRVECTGTSRCDVSCANGQAPIECAPGTFACGAC
jgi:hypothetical protein